VDDRSFWLKSVGATDDEIPTQGLTKAGEMQFVGFPNRGRPRVKGRDYLVYYAATHQRIYGIVEVFMPPTRDRDEKRWPWQCEVRPHLMLDSLDRAPSIDVLSVQRDFRKSVQRQSHIELTAEEYEAALRGLAVACDTGLGDFLTDYWPFRDAVAEHRRLGRFVWKEGDVEFLTEEEARNALGHDPNEEYRPDSES
jgi:hypothetical protein